MEKARKWSVEYSISQDCFHVDDIDYVIQRNLKRTLFGGGADYQIIAICDTQEEADNFASECRKKMEVEKNENV